MKLALSILAATTLAAPVFADAADGEKLFGRQCVACHVIVNDAGEKLAGRNARTGPNLYGVIGRGAGTVDGFRYSKSLTALGETGAVWDEGAVASFIQDPRGYVKEALDDGGAKSNMAFRVRKEDEAASIAAYLATFSAE